MELVSCNEPQFGPHLVQTLRLTALGTMVGDPIEYSSVKSIFGGSDRKEQLFLGSVKDNIGHCEAASGVAGVIKTLLMMHHKQIPKQASFTTLNPKIECGENIVIPTRTTAWSSNRCVALVNNYGAAGSNAALVIRQHSPMVVVTEEDTTHDERLSAAEMSYPLLLSANSTTSLQSYANSLRCFVQKSLRSSNGDRRWLETFTRDVARRQNCTLEHRSAFEVSTAEDIVIALEEIIQGSSLISSAPKSNPIVFCFGGQTGHLVSISKSLYRHTPAFKIYLVSWPFSHAFTVVSTAFNFLIGSMQRNL